MQSTKSGLIHRNIPFPDVFDSNNTVGFLVINGEIIHVNEGLCETNVDGLRLTVDFICQGPASPCVIEMWQNDTNTTLNGKNNINDTKMLEKSKSLTLNLKYAACRLDEIYTSNDCLININDGKTDKREVMDTKTIIIITFGLILLIVIVLITYKNIHRFLRDRKQRDCNFLKHQKRYMSKGIQPEEEELQETMFDIKDSVDNTKRDKNFCTQEKEFHPKLYSNVSNNSSKSDIYESTMSINEWTRQKQDSIIEILHSENGVMDINKYYDECKKKQGHDRFIDYDDFDVCHLPGELQENNVKTLIMSMADLTVLLTVSEATDAKTTRKVKIGNGWVGFMSIYKKGKHNTTCCCKMCLLSPNPSTIYAKIVIYTTTHVVRNDKEAKLTICRLFYENSESPFVILDEVIEECAISQEQEKCKLKFLTCNAMLIQKLKNARKSWVDLYSKVNEDFKSKCDALKTVITVSHIHGLPKKISIGQWIDRKENKSPDYGNVTSYTYNTPTCVGSTGAYMYIVSRDKTGWLHQHFHHGISMQNNNFCGIGKDYENEIKRS